MTSRWSALLFYFSANKRRRHYKFYCYQRQHR